MKHRNLILPVMLLLAFTSTTFALVSTRAMRDSPTELLVSAPATSAELPGAAIALPTSVQGNTPREARQGEVIPLTLHNRGCEPDEVTRPAGSYLLVVNNRSGLRELTLRLEQESGARAGAARLTARRQRWREIMRLTPGRYTLRVAEHPEWACHLTITPR